MKSSAASFDHAIHRSMGGLICAALIGLSSHAAFGQAANFACGSLENAYGPYDYRTTKSKLHIVERYHFTPEVEALIRGKSGGRIGADLDYTLRAFPNHHRALLALMRYGEKAKSPQPYDLPHPVECYFERALRFRPDDTLARMIYAQFLATKKRAPEADRQLEIASASADDDNGFSHYNIGLIYFDLKNYPKALVQAHMALKLGFAQTGLKDKLKGVGQWSEPVEAEPSKPAASGSEHPPG
jgi:hypothetical protein